ncbi:MAG TPA: hypothetical protein VMZ28_15775 [Kofleriaceae bacterium]|nr:hypothetical protein [Kofleriaceae bacterium]
MRRTTWLLLCLATAMTLGAAHLRAQPSRPGFQIIVHPANGATSVDRGFLRDAFLRKLVTWSNGETIRPVDLPRRLTTRDRFTRDVLKKTPTQLRSFWNRQIFSGTGVPPIERSSEAAVIAYVLANRGAIGYLPEGSDPRGAKVIRLR